MLNIVIDILSLNYDESAIIISQASSIEFCSNESNERANIRLKSSIWEKELIKRGIRFSVRAISIE